MTGDCSQIFTNVRLLEEDRALAAVLSDDERALARRCSVAKCFQLERGLHQPRELLDGDGLSGLLVPDGLIVRQVTVADRCFGELVGPRDILRPHDDLGPTGSLPFEVRWGVVEEMRPAVLDRQFVALIARWPRLMGGSSSCPRRRVDGAGADDVRPRSISSLGGLTRGLLPP